MNKKRWSILVIVLLLLGGSVWAYGFRKHPALARMEELRVQMNDENLTRDQRRDLFGQMREQYEKLPESLQSELRAKRESEGAARDDNRMAEFFAMTPEEQRKALDRDIDREEGWRKRREQQEKAGAGGAGGSGAGAGGRGGDGKGGGRGGRGNGDSLQRRKDYLNRTSPDSRARRTEYRRMRDDRRAQRGLPQRPSRF